MIAGIAQLVMWQCYGLGGRGSMVRLLSAWQIFVCLLKHADQTRPDQTRPDLCPQGRIDLFHLQVQQSVMTLIDRIVQNRQSKFDHVWNANATQIKPTNNSSTHHMFQSLSRATCLDYTNSHHRAGLKKIKCVVDLKMQTVIKYLKLYHEVIFKIHI